METPRNGAQVREVTRRLSPDLDQVSYAGRAATTEVRKSGIIDTANERIAVLTERLAASNAELEREFDRVLGPRPEGDHADGQDRSTDPGSANELHYRLSLLEGVAEALMATATRVRAL